MIKLNLNITNKHPQTITYQEWLNHINNNTQYNNILNQLIQHIEIKVKHTDKNIINRILSYYLIPQNHNKLDYASLHQFDKQFKTSIHEFTKNNIIITQSENFNTYYKFSKPIEQLIIRLYNLEILTNHESNNYTT